MIIKDKLIGAFAIAVGMGSLGVGVAQGVELQSQIQSDARNNIVTDLPPWMQASTRAQIVDVRNRFVEEALKGRTIGTAHLFENQIERDEFLRQAGEVSLIDSARDVYFSKRNESLDNVNPGRLVSFSVGLGGGSLLVLTGALIAFSGPSRNRPEEVQL
jgi:hypothetical protein